MHVGDNSSRPRTIEHWATDMLRGLEPGLEERLAIDSQNFANLSK
jgi:hypothetical protein